jgi:rhodanese-related sulfurtransferase/DNA-binding transcriptional ArsR family regulator
MKDHRTFKDSVYGEFSRIGQALAHPKRLEVLDLLAQGPRHVDALAQEMGLSVASASQHIQVLRHARLLESTREGTRTIYRLAGKEVLRLLLALRGVAELRLAEVDRLTRDRQASGREDILPRERLQELVEEDQVYLLDVRPPLEYDHGHLPGAISLPLDEIPSRLTELPRDREIIVYCRGAYCLWAGEALDLLRQHGFRASRVEGGWEEWWDEERPVVAAG